MPTLIFVIVLLVTTYLAAAFLRRIYNRAPRDRLDEILLVALLAMFNSWVAGVVIGWYMGGR